MTADRTVLGAVDWPEGLAARDGGAVAERVLDLFRTHLDVDPSGAGTVLVFVPDPRGSANSEDWIRAQMNSIVQRDYELHAFSCGRGGLGYWTTTVDRASDFVAVFLAMGSTLLNIIAIPDAPGDLSDADLDHITKWFTGWKVEPPRMRCVNMLFDMGILWSVDYWPRPLDSPAVSEGRGFLTRLLKRFTNGARD